MLLLICWRFDVWRSGASKEVRDSVLRGVACLREDVSVVEIDVVGFFGKQMLISGHDVQDGGNNLGNSNVV